MKVYMGPYRNWFGPYQLAELLQYVGFSEDYCQALGERLNKTWLKSFFERIDKFKQRTVRVKIHNYDIWNMGDTLAVIILPMLYELKKKKMGSPHVDDEDVPEHLRSTYAPALTEEQKNTACGDVYLHYRWSWVLDEMIWAFEQVTDDEADTRFHYDLDPAKPRHEPGIEFSESMRRGGFDREGYLEWQERKSRGLRLFGKYYEALWD
jgi:hypothetical protein